MRMNNGLLVFAAVALLCWSGCSRNDTSDFRQYAADDPGEAGLTVDTPPAKSDSGSEKIAPKTLSQSPISAGDWTDGLPAVLGFGSRVILGETFRLNGEFWLTPAVGAGPTLALINKVSQSGITKVSLPRKVQILIKEKTFRTEGPEEAVRVSYNDIDLLRVINMEPVTPDAPEQMPAWLKDLDGKRIRIRGFMSPAFRQTGLRGFLMGRDNEACCFPGRAKLYDLFPVRLRNGVTTDYIQGRPFDVVGVFEIKLWVEGGKMLQLYEISDAVVVQ